MEEIKVPHKIEELESILGLAELFFVVFHIPHLD
jgi:hypothetical protein